MVTWRDRVALSCSAHDQHTPGVFLPALARVGYGLFFRLRKVLIWTYEGRSLMGGVPGDDVCSARAGFSGCLFPVLVFLSFYLFWL